MDILQAVEEAAVTKRLTLRNLVFKHLPPVILDLTDLQELTLTGCRVSLPTNLTRLRHLRRLDLSDSFLLGYPEVVNRMSGLEQLGLNGTGLWAVPDGIAALENLTSLGLADNNLERFPLPKAFFAVKEQLEQMGSNFITFAQNDRLCRSKGVHPQASQEMLISFLHDLGTVLCFRDDPRLADTNILNPAWATGGVYKILNSSLAAQRKGLLTVDDVRRILDSIDYPLERRMFIADMMKKFELCYESDGMFLVPDLLTKEEPDTGSWDDALEFVIKYDVLPPSFMCRLIVRMHGLISKGTVWRTGVVLALDSNRALVKADREEGTITMRVSGPAHGQRGLLTAVLAETRSIAQTIPGLTFEELVPVPQRPGVRVPYRHLRDLEAAGHKSVIPQGMVTPVSIKALLDGVESPVDRQPARVGPHEVAPAGTFWTARNALTLLGVLLAAIAILFGVTAWAFRLTDSMTLPILATVTGSVMLAGAFALRATGLLSEQGFGQLIKDLLARRTASGEQPPPS